MPEIPVQRRDFDALKELLEEKIAHVGRINDERYGHTRESTSLALTDLAGWKKDHNDLQRQFLEREKDFIRRPEHDALSTRIEAQKDNLVDRIGAVQKIVLLICGGLLVVQALIGVGVAIYLKRG